MMLDGEIMVNTTEMYVHANFNVCNIAHLDADRFCVFFYMRMRGKCVHFNASHVQQVSNTSTGMPTPHPCRWEHEGLNAMAGKAAQPTGSYC